VLYSFFSSLQSRTNLLWHFFVKLNENRSRKMWNWLESCLSFRSTMSSTLLISFKLSLDVNALNFQLPQLAHFRSVLMSRLSCTSALIDQWDFNQQNCGTEIGNCIARDLILPRVSCRIFRAISSIKFESSTRKGNWKIDL
jgi:hypothetical protein